MIGEPSEIPVKQANRFIDDDVQISIYRMLDRMMFSVFFLISWGGRIRLWFDLVGLVDFKLSLSFIYIEKREYSELKTIYNQVEKTDC